MSEEKCKCGDESTINGHGVKDGKVYSEYWCDSCYNKKDVKAKDHDKH